MHLQRKWQKFWQIRQNDWQELHIYTRARQDKAGFVVWSFFFLRQVSIFHCEIASADEAEFTNFLCAAEQPLPNSNPHEPYCSVFVAHVAWKLSLGSQIC